jgi:flagellar protein FliO/FliZ
MWGPNPTGPKSAAMHIADVVRMVAALAVTLGLIGLCVVALRKFGPETLRRLQGVRRDRRLSVVETLVLDPSRRLVLVRFDAEERLILLGDGRMLSSSPVSSSVLKDQA